MGSVSHSVTCYPAALSEVTFPLLYSSAGAGTRFSDSGGCKAESTWAHCRSKCAFSFCRNVSTDVTDMTTSGRPFQILGPAAVANERSATVARRDGWTSSRLEVDDRRRPLAHRHISDTAQFFREIAGCCAVQSSVDEDCQFELDTLRTCRH